MSAWTWTIDPDAVLDFHVDWTSWLDDGETITAQSVTVTAGTVTITDVAQANGIVTFWASEAAKPRATVTCQITTSAGRTDQRTGVLNVQER